MPDYTTTEGYRIYRQSLLFVLLIAADRIFPGHAVEVRQSVNRATYCEITDVLPDEDDISALTRTMRAIIFENMPLQTETLPREDAIARFRQSGDAAEAEKLTYSPCDSVTLLAVGKKYYSVYGQLVPRTGCLSEFELIAFDAGLLLRYPHPNTGGQMQPFHSGKKILKTINEYRAWSEVIGIHNVFELNRLIREDRINDCINISEIMHEKRLAAIADTIRNDMLHKKVILISGPSSSGKTTTANRLLLHLRACGLQPQVISLDDYYFGREQTPLDENGKPNYEDIDAIDYHLFNQHLLRLVSGDTVTVPRFDFTVGERAAKGRDISLPSGSVLVVEGIHALNRKLTRGIPGSYCYKIYCTALTVLCFDRYNPISPTDTRLIRRIIRDSRFRNTDAIGTLNMWDDVQKGEIKNIFPYEEEADDIFNSSLAYEFAVYRKSVESLLKTAVSDDLHGETARRLLDFIRYFTPLADTYVPRTSILREFIGGSSVTYH